MSILCDFCSPVSVSAVAGVLQNPSDASLFSSSSVHRGESHNGAAGETGHQRTEMLAASKTHICSTWPLQDGHSACSMHSSAGRIQASLDFKSCRSSSRLPILLQNVKGMCYFLSPKGWMGSMGCNRERPRSLVRFAASLSHHSLKQSVVPQLKKCINAISYSTLPSRAFAGDREGWGDLQRKPTKS